MSTYIAIAMTILGALLLSIVLAVVVLRIRAASQNQRLDDAIRAYVESRGGSIEFHDDESFTVKGPSGSGRRRLAALRFMCTPGEESRWEKDISFTLRQYIPDAFELAFARAAAARLTEIGPVVAAMSGEELLEKARVKLVGARWPATGLATCARPFGDRFEARVVLDGIDLDGIPESDRGRINMDDEALYEHALTASLPDEPPDAAAGRSETNLWLCRPQAVWGSAPAVIVGAGKGLAWTSAQPGDVEARLLALAWLSCEDGPMKCVMWAWDGAALSSSTVVVHTIMGPTTPDFTLNLPVSFHGPLGIHPAADGSFGVRQRRDGS